MEFFSYQIEMTRPTKVLIHLTIRREPGTEREKWWLHSAVFNIKRQEAQAGLPYPNRGQECTWLHECYSLTQWPKPLLKSILMNIIFITLPFTPKLDLKDLRVYDNHCFTPLIFFFFNIITRNNQLKKFIFHEKWGWPRGRHQGYLI